MMWKKVGITLIAWLVLRGVAVVGTWISGKPLAEAQAELALLFIAALWVGWAE